MSFSNHCFIPGACWGCSLSRLPVGGGRRRGLIGVRGVPHGIMWSWGDPQPSGLLENGQFPLSRGRSQGYGASGVGAGIEAVAFI